MISIAYYFNATIDRFYKNIYYLYTNEFRLSMLAKPLSYFFANDVFVK